MNEEIESILEEIIENGGDIVFNTEYMVCQSCGGNGSPAKSTPHDSTCIIQRARKLLNLPAQEVIP
jgi:hypothetical protein